MRRALKWLPWMLVVFFAYLYWSKITYKDLFPAKQPAAQVTLAPQQRTIIQGGTGVSSYHSAVAAAAPAVVNIFTTQHIKQSPLQQQMQDNPVLRHFFGIPQHSEPSAQDSTALGSGVIVSHDGYILTNNHVVADADSIVVALQDGRKAKATVVGTDPESDVAVLKIALNNLPVLPFKTTDVLVGDVVLAIGNPFGVGQTVTQGIISATGRSGLGINAFEDFIQTDAAINPGNSGGALVDIAGNLVGINTAIFSKSGGSMGIGFAIPVTLANSVMQSIIKDGKVTRGWLGIEVKGGHQEVDDFKVDTPIKDAGVMIMGVVNNGPADKGGIRVGDRILKLNGQTLTGASELISRVAGVKPNTEIALLVSRNGQEIKLNVTVAERPKPVSKQGSPIEGDGGNNDNPRQAPLPEELIERFFFGQ